MTTHDNVNTLKLSLLFLMFSLISCGGGINTSTDSVQTASPVTLNSNTANELEKFGTMLRFNSNGSAIAISMDSTGTSPSYIKGSVQIFNKSSNWMYGQSLIPEDLPDQVFAINSYNGFFGSAFSFSPDGITLAIAHPDTKIVHIYQKQKKTWLLQQKIEASSNSFGFGSAIQFSPDSKTLAIGVNQEHVNSIPYAGTVHLYNYQSSSSQWSFSYSIKANNQSDSNYFGSAIAFSPDGTTLAVNEVNGDTTTVNDAGLVHLFTLNNTTWTHIQVLKSSNPTISSTGLGHFGGDLSSHASFVFSPNSQTLAIGEYNSDLTNSGFETGSVELFIKQNSNWVFDEVLVNNPLEFNPTDITFGTAVSFRADGNMIAVGQSFGISSVSLFKKINSRWEQQNEIVMYNEHITFSPTGNLLAIGNPRETVTNIDYAGEVILYDTK